MLLMLRLLSTFSWQELKHHRWRNAAAVLAVMLGVALAFSVQLINASALSEFSQAVRSVNGQPDLELRAVRGGFDEALYARVANDPQVAAASPVLELATYALTAGGQRIALRVVGVDALVVAALAPALMPMPAPMPTGCHCRARQSLFEPRCAASPAWPRPAAAKRPAVAGRASGRQRGRRWRPAGGDGHWCGAGSVWPHRPALAH